MRWESSRVGRWRSWTMTFPACSLTVSPTEWAASWSAVERECCLTESESSLFRGAEVQRIVEQATETVSDMLSLFHSGWAVVWQLTAWETDHPVYLSAVYPPWFVFCVSRLCLWKTSTSLFLNFFSVQSPFFSPLPTWNINFSLICPQLGGLPIPRLPWQPVPTGEGRLQTFQWVWSPQPPDAVH